MNWMPILLYLGNIGYGSRGKYWHSKGKCVWMFPIGVFNEVRDICMAAIREVKEGVGMVISNCCGQWMASLAGQLNMHAQDRDFRGGSLELSPCQIIYKMQLVTGREFELVILSPSLSCMDYWAIEFSTIHFLRALIGFQEGLINMGFNRLISMQFRCLPAGHWAGTTVMGFNIPSNSAADRA